MYALQDFFGALKDIRAWSYLAMKQIQFDYRRNLLGTSWIILSFALTSGGLGWLLAQLQGRSIPEHVTYVAFGFVVWNFVLACVTEGCTALTRNRSLLLQSPIDRSGFVFSLVLKKLYLLGFNLLTAVVLALILGWRPNMTVIAILPGILVLTYTAVGTVTAFAVIGTVLRDFSELVAAIMRLAFFFTPIIWYANARFDRVGDDSPLSLLARYNPFSHFIEIVRGGALGYWPAWESWLITLGIGTLALIIGLGVLQWLGRRLVFWL